MLFLVVQDQKIFFRTIETSHVAKSFKNNIQFQLCDKLNQYILSLTTAMARPKNKEELLTQSEENFNKIFDLIRAMPDENIGFSGTTMNRNIRDIFMHLHHWHLMMLNWYNIGMKGNKPTMPAKGYT